MVRSITFSITGTVTGSITIEDSTTPSLTTIFSGAFTQDVNALLQVVGTDIGAQWVWSGGETQVGDNFSAAVETGQTISLQVIDPSAITRLAMTDAGVDTSLTDLLTALPSLQRLTANGNALDGSFPATLVDSMERFLVSGSPITGTITDISNTAMTQFDVSDCSLSAVDVGFAVPNTITSFLASGNALPEAGVDAILAACVAAGVTNATIALEGGTNAPPSAQGLADKATLEGAGCTVTVTAGEPSEFITNGGFDADTDWTKGAGWTIAAGAATNAAGTLNQLTQEFGDLVEPLVSGNDYVLSFDLDNAEEGTVTVILSVAGTMTQNVYNSTGNQTGIIVPFTAAQNHTRIGVRDTDQVPISVDNISIVPA